VPAPSPYRPMRLVSKLKPPAGLVGVARQKIGPWPDARTSCGTAASAAAKQIKIFLRIKPFLRISEQTNIHRPAWKGDQISNVELRRCRSGGGCSTRSGSMTGVETVTSDAAK